MYLRFAFLILTFAARIITTPFPPIIGLTWDSGIEVFVSIRSLRQALVLMLKTFTTTEILIIVFAIGGFLASFILAFVFITAYSPLQALVEFISELTERRSVLILLFVLALLLFAVLYLLLQGKNCLVEMKKGVIMETEKNTLVTENQ